MPEHDAVNHPRHYASHPRFTIECIEITRLMTFDAGNAWKYLWRYEQKNGVEDLRKAIWYLSDLAQHDTTPVWVSLEAKAIGLALIGQHVLPYMQMTNPVDAAMLNLANDTILLHEGLRKLAA